MIHQLVEHERLVQNRALEWGQPVEQELHGQKHSGGRVIGNGQVEKTQHSGHVEDELGMQSEEKKFDTKS